MFVGRNSAIDSKLHFILTMTEIGKLSQMPNIGLNVYCMYFIHA